MDTAEAAAALRMATREVLDVEDVIDGTLATTHDANIWHIATDDDGTVVRHDATGDALRAGEPIVTLYGGPAADPKKHPENLRVDLYAGPARPGERRKPRRPARAEKTAEGGSGGGEKAGTGGDQPPAGTGAPKA